MIQTRIEKVANRVWKLEYRRNFYATWKFYGYFKTRVEAMKYETKLNL